MSDDKSAFTLPAKQLALFQDAITRVNYKFHGSYGPIGVLCGYWRTRALKAIE